MATYKDPFASPDPPSIAHEANRIFMKLIDDGNEVYHMYEQFYFFKTKEGPVPFDKIRSMYWILFNLGYLPYWRIGVQHSVCKLVLQKCKAVAKPWTPLPADSRLITPLGTTPTRLEYAAYMMDVVQFGMHKPDGVNGMIRQLKITLPPRRGRKAKAVVASVAAPQAQMSAPASATPQKVPATNDRQEDLIGVALPESESHIDPQDGTRLLTDMMLRESVIENTKEK